MLTPERHQLILETLKANGIAKIQELVELTNTSESTIRRDLTVLEEQKLLKRVHGGASLSKPYRLELGIDEKSTKHLQEKINIAKYAASLVQDGDCIYLDAGTTTYQVLSYLVQKDILIVTNGINHLEALLERKITTYLIGGLIKAKTRAVTGAVAHEAIQNYRFDKCFLGVNGIHIKYGYTTPDPEEAILKAKAIELAKKTYVLADHSKVGEVSFAKIAELNKAEIITSQLDDELALSLTDKTKLKVVKI